MSKTWLITGISSGFGKALTEQLLANGDTVIGTVRKDNKDIRDLQENFPDTLDVSHLDVTNLDEIHQVVKDAFSKHKQIDVLINNAGYGLFGAAEELSDDDVNLILATNLTGSIQMIRSFIPYLRKQGHGRIIQISSYGGQVAYPGNSMYHATKFGIEGFCEAVAQELKPFNIGVTIIEPGGARTEFRYGSAHVANLMPEYDQTPTHDFLKMLDPANGLAPGDPSKMASRIIETVDQTPAPLHVVLGSKALRETILRLTDRLHEYQSETDMAASTDIE
ncbi:SDR family oxidoreductase [Xylocopilactobacillus apis]|uniref:Short-chain dehydrogenase/reductase n=1 Tax=Xylocopilactobacillus apis TaxID=2932183 RepID=A0AAU9D2U2_9LACO|nr:SDR family oxidoreductase [Xylocopilactobacillus apis]BDR56816.1 short-chain dehydrogenase/reductase [Xylocopilactobacillus apis]